MEKAVQLYQIQQLRHGVMMVGPSGSGKSTAWRVLLDAMTSLDGVKGESYVIDPKAISKEQLYGTLGKTPCSPLHCDVSRRCIPLRRFISHRAVAVGTVGTLHHHTLLHIRTVQTPLPWSGLTVSSRACCGPS